MHLDWSDLDPDWDSMTTMERAHVVAMDLLQGAITGLIILVLALGIAAVAVTAVLTLMDYPDSARTCTP